MYLAERLHRRRHLQQAAPRATRRSPSAGTAPGGRCRRPSPPTPRDGLSGVSCSSASACTAVGDYASNAEAPEETLAERWNGTQWSLQPTPNPGPNNELSDISCSSASACTAVGEQFAQGEAGTLAERWNGTQWSTQTTPNSGRSGLEGVSCPSASACTAVGLGGSSSDETLTERWTR